MDIDTARCPIEIKRLVGCPQSGKACYFRIPFARCIEGIDPSARMVVRQSSYTSASKIAKPESTGAKVVGCVTDIYVIGEIPDTRFIVDKL